MVLAHLVGPTVEEPWPYHIVIEGDGFILGKANADDTDFLSSRPQDLTQVAPSAYGYAAQNPLFGQTNVYRHMALGMGLAEQHAQEDRRYLYALNADLSTANHILKGPYIVSHTVVAGENTRWSFDLLGQVYYIAGRYLYRRTGDTTSLLIHDFGAGARVWDVLEFTSPLTGLKHIYFAMGDGVNIWRYDGSAAPAQHATLKARRFCLVGEQLFRAHNVNEVAVLDIRADPWIEADWSAGNAFIVSDRTAGITGMVVHPAGSMVIFKEDGIYTLSDQGDWRNLFSEFRFALHEDNGRVFANFLDALYVVFREGVFRITFDFRLEGASPPFASDSPVQGHITALRAHGNQRLYAGLWNPDTGSSYLIALGGYDIDPETGEEVRVLRWHGSLTPEYPARTISWLGRTTVAAPTGHANMVLGFSDGSVGTFTLPHTADPLGCDEYRFSLPDGLVRFARFKGAFFTENKAFSWVLVAADRVDASDYCQVRYRFNEGEEWLTLGENFNVVPTKTVEFPIDSPLSIALDLELLLHSTSITSCPVVSEVALRSSTRPDLEEVHEFHVISRDGLRRLDGVPERKGREEVEELIRSYFTRPTVTATILGGKSVELSFLDWVHAQAYEEPGGKLHASIKVTAAEIRRNLIYGTIGRLTGRTIGSLAGTTIGELREI